MINTALILKNFLNSTLVILEAVRIPGWNNPSIFSNITPSFTAEKLYFDIFKEKNFKHN